jgi:hypothetical protein
LLALIALVHLIVVAIMPANSTTNTPTDCNGLLHTTDYTQAVHLQAQTEQMGAVEVFKQLAGGKPAALVQVNHNDTQHTLDVYVFGCIKQQPEPRLLPLFTRRGLAQGMAEVSQANTLIISSVDPNISAEESAFLQPLQQNVYQEFAWQHGQFQQVAFPGLYPVASRAEAQAMQQESDAGQAMPWKDPLATAEQLAYDIFKWPSSNSQDGVISNDGTTAQVQLVQTNPHMVVQVTLKRLIRQDSKGLWFVVSAHTQGITVGINDQNFAALPLNSTETPFVKSTFTLHGASALADGQTSTTLFDHTLTPISTANNVPLQVNSDGTYSGTISYANIAPGQQGLLLIQSLPTAANSNVEDGQLLLVGIILQ